MPNGDELEKRVRERAYFIWLTEGQPEGRDKEHWEMARSAMEERDERAEQAQTATRKLPRVSFASLHPKKATRRRINPAEPLDTFQRMTPALVETVMSLLTPRCAARSGARRLTRAFNCTSTSE